MWKNSKQSECWKKLLQTSDELFSVICSRSLWILVKRLTLHLTLQKRPGFFPSNFCSDPRWLGDWAGSWSSLCIKPKTKAWRIPLTYDVWMEPNISFERKCTIFWLGQDLVHDIDSTTHDGWKHKTWNTVVLKSFSHRRFCHVTLISAWSGTFKDAAEAVLDFVLFMWSVSPLTSALIGIQSNPSKMHLNSLKKTGYVWLLLAWNYEHIMVSCCFHGFVHVSFLWNKELRHQVNLWAMPANQNLPEVWCTWRFLRNWKIKATNANKDKSDLKENKAQ